MKKNKMSTTTKWVLFAIIITVLLTWILPTSYYQYSLVSDGTRNQVGLFDLFSYPTVALSYFGNIVVYILVIGGFYGVLYKIGAYGKLLNKIAEKAKGKEIIILSVIMVLLAVLTSISGASLGLLMIVPFIISLVLLMGYDKITAAMVTVGSIAVGMIGTTISSTYVTGDYGIEAQNGMGIVNSILQTNSTDLIIAKLIILVIGLALLIIFTKYRIGNKDNKKDGQVYKVNVVLYVILTILTFGIFAFYWHYSIVSDAKNLSKKDKLPSAGMVLFLSIITGGIYLWYAYYKIGKMLYDLDSKKENKDDKSILYLLLAIFLPLINMILVQLHINKFGKEKKLGSSVLVAETTELENSLLIPKEINKKGKIWPIVLIFDVIFIIMILSQISWTTVFKINLFSDITTAVSNFKIFGFPIFGKLLGNVPAFEQWTIENITVLLLIGSLILSLIYKMKFKEYIDGLVSGAKKALKPAVLVALIYCVLVITNLHPFILTIVKPLISSKFNVFTAILTSFISSIFNVDMYYSASNVLPYLTSIMTDTTVYSKLALVWQTIYGFTALVAPTSVILIAILSYLDIPYGKWLKSSGLLIFSILLMILLVLIALIFI